MKFSLGVDFLRETVIVSASGIELGDLGAATTDIVFDAGAGAGAIRNTVELGGTGTKRAY